MATKQKTLADAFYDNLRDAFFAERQSVRALKKSAKAAMAEELRQAFETHAEESAQQLERLHQVFEVIGRPARSKTCEAIQGLAAEAEDDMEDFGGGPAADAVLIGNAQAIEHYEIARYGTLKTWASQLGFEKAANLLDQTLQEEKRTDELLTQLSESVNQDGIELEDQGGGSSKGGKGRGRSS